MGGFVKRKNYPDDPSIGLKVTITGRHNLHGYHAVIRDVVGIDEIGPVSYSVEVEATRRLETIHRMNLTIRQCVLPFMTVTNVFNSNYTSEMNMTAGG